MGPFCSKYVVHCTCKKIKWITTLTAYLKMQFIIHISLLYAPVTYKTSSTCFNHLFIFQSEHSSVLLSKSSELGLKNWSWQHTLLKTLFIYTAHNDTPKAQSCFIMFVKSFTNTSVHNSIGHFLFSQLKLHRPLMLTCSTRVTFYASADITKSIP